MSGGVCRENAKKLGAPYVIIDSVESGLMPVASLLFCRLQRAICSGHLVAFDITFDILESGRSCRQKEKKAEAKDQGTREHDDDTGHLCLFLLTCGSLECLCGAWFVQGLPWLKMVFIKLDMKFNAAAP